MLHLSYHDGMHYNSVRCADDHGPGKPQPVVISGSGLVAAAPSGAAAGGREVGPAGSNNARAG